MPHYAPSGRAHRLAGALGLIAVSVAVACSLGVARNDSSVNSPALRIGLPQGTIGTDPSSGIGAAARLFSYENLTTIGRDGRPVPRMLQGWSTSPDGLEWTLTLRPNTRYHDGSRVTAEDVRALILVMRDSVAGLGAVREIRALEPSQIVISLSQPSSMLVDELYQPLRKKSGAREVSVGPFEIVSQRKDEVVLKPNVHYYGARPSLDQVTFRAFTTLRETYAAFLRGEIDGIWDVDQEAIEFVSGQSGVAMHTFLRPYALVIATNAAVPVFTDPRIRQALNFAVDRAQVIKLALRGHGREAGLPVWSDHWAFDARYAGFTYEPQRAKALMRAAGIGNSSRLSFTCLLADGYDDWERAALVVQQQLADVGIDMRVLKLPFPQVIERMRTTDFDAVLLNMLQGPGLNLPYRHWRSPTTRASWNTWNYHSARLDAAFDALVATTDATSYRRAVSAVQQAFMDDPPAVPLAWRETARAFSRRFEIIAPPGQDVLVNVSSWRAVATDPRRAH